MYHPRDCKKHSWLCEQRRSILAVIDEFQNANEAYASTFQKGNLAMPPARRVAIVTCMDARIDPARALGLEEGDAHVIRNAGGRVADALRSLIISEQLLGTTHIVVVHHTDCGMLTFSNEDLRSKVKQELHADADAIDFLPFGNLEQSVRDDVAVLKASPFIPDSIDIQGYIYDVKTGKILPVT
jgi:carbonic anhydrase